MRHSLVVAKQTPAGEHLASRVRELAGAGLCAFWRDRRPIRDRGPLDHVEPLDGRRLAARRAGLSHIDLVQ